MFFGSRFADSLLAACVVAPSLGNCQNLHGNSHVDMLSAAASVIGFATIAYGMKKAIELLKRSRRQRPHYLTQAHIEKYMKRRGYSNPKIFKKNKIYT